MLIHNKIKEPVLPPIVVDTRAPITIGTQITEQIKFLIVLGKLQPNQALPPLVRLAEHLAISHNTVNQVYNELVTAGYLVAQRGKGTFIADSPQVKQIIARKHFYDLLGEAFTAASTFGISAAEFSAAAYAQAVIKERHKLSLVFINFLPDAIIDVTASIKAETNLVVPSIDWKNLQAKKSSVIKQVLAADLIVTSTKHLWDVADLLPDFKKEVIGIDLQPDLPLLSRISSLARNAKVLFVCKEQVGSEAMKQMSAYNINHIESTALALDYVQNNTQELREFDLVICSPLVESQLNNYVLHQKLMVFGVRIDPVNLLVLQARLAAVGMEKSL